MKRLGVLAAAVLVLLAAWFAFEQRNPSRSKDTADTLAVTPPMVDRDPAYPDTVLQATLEAIAKSAPGNCGIVAKHLGTGAVARVNPDLRVPLMSVVKLPVALVVLDGVDHGRWALDTPVTLLPQDMHPRGWLGDRFPRGGGPVRLLKLVEEMVQRSDNTAADALMRLVGGPHEVTQWLERHEIRDLRVDRTERALGNDWYGLPPGADTMGSAEEIRVIRAQVSDAVHDSAAAAMLLDPRDTGTAEACVHLLERLWSGDLLSTTMTDTLKSILADCKTAPNRLPAQLPKGTPVARKTGTGGTWRGLTVAINDVGVIRLPNGDEVAIAVLVAEPRGHVRRAERTIARAARAVYDAWSVESTPRTTAGITK
jgi:beta-lactamase class A